MNIRPGITTHLKFVRFKRRIGEQEALEYIIDLFAHCQADCRGENWGAVSNEYVEDVCRWEGPSGVLYEALAAPFENKLGWIQRDERGNLIVTGWNEENRYLIRNWCANQHASAGIRERFKAYIESRLQMKLKLQPPPHTGDLKDEPKETPNGVLEALLNDSPTVEPLHNITLHKIPMGGGEPPPPIESLKEVPKEEPEELPCASAPSEPPFEWEIKNAAAEHFVSLGSSPIPADYASYYWRKKNEKPESWFDGRTKKRINFVQQLANWWMEDQWKPEWNKNGAVGSLAARLAKETAPEKRAALREQMERASA